MAVYDLIVRNGYIIDGTGAAGYYADIGVQGGRISEIGNLRGVVAKEEIEASGMVVAPGHITQHTHYDAMLFWNPYCSNSGENGVTTVVNANCGFGFAPVRAADRERTMQMMETTEQIPVRHQQAAMSWDWETFPEYLERVKALPKGLNVFSYLPLNPLLVYVMGIEGAKSRKPTASEIAEMHRLINEAMDAGALGISLSAMGYDGNSHLDFDGTAMPTDAMEIESLIEIGRAVANRGEGINQMLTNIVSYGPREFTERMAEMAKGSGARVIHNILITADGRPDLADEGLEWIEGLRRRGLDVVAQTISRGWVEGGVTELDVSGGQLPAIREITGCRDQGALRALLRDPGFQQRFVEQYRDSGAMTGSAGFEPQTVIDIGPNAELHSYVGRTIGAVAEETGQTAAEVVLDLTLRSDLALKLKSGSFASSDPAEIVRMIRHPAVTIGVSDGGAHTKSLAHGYYGTDLLIWLVREHRLMSIEEMHFHLSLKVANLTKLRNRGAILPGYSADLLIYDLDKLFVDHGPMEIVKDMPDGDWRRNVRSGGYHYILVNGVATHVQDRKTGATPGEFVRWPDNDRGAYQVAAE